MDGRLLDRFMVQRRVSVLGFRVQLEVQGVRLMVAWLFMDFGTHIYRYTYLNIHIYVYSKYTYTCRSPSLSLTHTHKHDNTLHPPPR